MNKQKKINFEILDLLKKILDKYAPQIKKNGLTISNPEIHIINDDIKHYTSEICSYVYKGQNIIDAIEFLIFFDGHPQATIKEFEEWINRVIEDLLKM